MKLILRVRARQDIDSVLDYTEATHGADAAEAYFTLVELALIRLTEHPQLGMARPDLSCGMRSYPVGEHRIYYLLTTDRVLIVRILHKSMDEIRHL